MIERFHLGAELEPRIHQILEKGSHRSPDLRKTIPFLSDLFNIVEAPSETLDNLLQPRNEFVASKRINREMEGPNGISAIAQAREWEMIMGGAGGESPVGRMG